jgi:transcriptional regulator with XRE-family HTH domain
MKVKELIGRNIRRHREMAEMKQEVLANTLGISASALSQIETGKTDVSVERIEQIAEALNKSFFELITTPNHVGGIKSGIDDNQVLNQNMSTLIEKMNALMTSLETQSK